MSMSSFLCLLQPSFAPSPAPIWKALASLSPRQISIVILIGRRGIFGFFFLFLVVGRKIDEQILSLPYFIFRFQGLMFPLVLFGGKLGE